MNIYLDIDGVLLTKEGEPALAAIELLEYVVQNHSVYWLTTHCQGEDGDFMPYLAQKFPSTVLPLLSQIKRTSWRTLKTEAIDFSQKFIWLDDYVLQSEKQKLIEYQVPEAVIEVDLKNKPEQLRDVLQWLKTKDIK